MASNIQLFHCLRNSIKRAMTIEEESERNHLLGAIDQILNIILIRHDDDFYVNYYAKGLSLLHKGQLLAGEDARSVSGLSIPVNLDPDANPDIKQKAIETLARRLASLVEMMPSSGSIEIKQYLDEVTDWETELYAKVHEAVPQPEQDIVPEVKIDKTDFERYLKNKFPEWKDLKINRFYRIPGGFSKTTILVETEDAVNGPQAMVIRAMQATYICKLHAYDIVDEYPIVKIAFNAGLPVAEPLWLEDNKTCLGTTFMVSRQVTGKNYGSAIGPAEQIPQAMMQSLIENLAKTHNVTIQDYEDLIAESKVLSRWYRYPTVADYNRERNNYWKDLADEAGALASPLIVRAFRWLEDNIEACDDKPTLIHGDYGLHNILIENDQVAALLDWETAHIGDPAFELSWIYLCTGKQYEPKKLLQMYRDAGGREISEFAFHYHQVFHCIMMPITCMASTKLFNKRLDNILYAVFGLLYMHYNTSHLNSAIELAETARPR